MRMRKLALGRSFWHWQGALTRSPEKAFTGIPATLAIARQSLQIHRTRRPQRARLSRPTSASAKSDEWPGLRAHRYLPARGVSRDDLLRGTTSSEGDRGKQYVPNPVSANTFAITDSPSQSNRPDGCEFFRG